MGNTRVFISSRIKEMVDERNRIEQIIKNPPFNLIPIRSENWGSRSEHTEAVCRGEVRGSHIILVILGKEFSPMVKIEYEEANKPPKKDVLIFLKDVKSSREPELEQFISDIGTNYFWSLFKNLNELEKLVKDSIIATFEKKYQRQRQKRLVIEFDPTNPNLLGFVKYEDKPLLRKFARVEIWNYGDEVAKNTKAILKVIKKKYTTCKLHFANTRENTAEPEFVEIHNQDVRILDVVFSQPEEATTQEFIQRPVFTSSDIIISGGALPLINNRLTDRLPGTKTYGIGQSYENALQAKNEGCYIATNDALRNPLRYG
jgi:hypothetical protein